MIKLSINFILIFGLLFTLTACKEKDSVQCLAKPKEWPEKVQAVSDILDRPFAHCHEGDIITVSTKTYSDKGNIDIRAIHYSKIYANDVDNYCSFAHPIIPLGTSKIAIRFMNNENDPNGHIEHFNENWFSCIYIGNFREFR